MKSLKYLYKIGNGPSSSHTMGPKNACDYFLNEYPNCNRFVVTLYGSLALTGKGHLTDYIIKKTLINVDILFDYKTITSHPNTMDIAGFNNDAFIVKKTFCSIGGGALTIDGIGSYLEEDLYHEKSFKDIMSYIKDKNISLDEYVDIHEDVDVYFNKVLDVMFNTLENGLNSESIILGKLKLKRKAKKLLSSKLDILDSSDDKKILAYAYATAEENASGGLIVTAPTCGASGVLPAVIYYLKDKLNLDRSIIIKGLKVAGVIGNIIKENGSISGAEAGCQAEIGTACSMASAFATYVLGGDIKNIERASEIALEHHLGLTCDPVGGYVQIPCIERNAVAALRAIDAAKLALLLNDSDAKISLDVAIETMLETGVSLAREFRETSQGGLATKLMLGDDGECI